MKKYVVVLILMSIFVMSIFAKDIKKQSVCEVNVYARGPNAEDYVKNYPVEDIANKLLPLLQQDKANGVITVKYNAVMYVDILKNELYLIFAILQSDVGACTRFEYDKNGNTTSAYFVPNADVEYSEYKMSTKIYY